jgi:hypothetical protein
MPTLLNSSQLEGPWQVSWECRGVFDAANVKRRNGALANGFASLASRISVEGIGRYGARVSGGARVFTSHAVLNASSLLILSDIARTC